MDLLPHAFLFRFAVSLPHAAGLPAKGKWPVGKAGTDLPLFSTLDRPNETVSLQAAWNEAGFGVVAEIRGKSEPAYAKADEPAAGDGLHLWIDTRNTQGAHRAGRFCHRFALLPAVGRGRSAKPLLTAVDIPRSRETATTLDLTDVRWACETKPDGWRIEVWFPAESLRGFDPEASPRIGFHAVVKDAETGDRPLTVGDEFPTDHDPSLWTTLELLRG